MSSRNQYLSPVQRIEGLVISQAMKKIIQILDGKKSNLTIAKEEIDSILKDPLWNYLEMRDADTLSDNLSNSKKITLLGVYQLGTTRLLDNMQMELE
jgi:pantothenate synthetase